MSDMVEVVIDSIRVSLVSQQQVLLLRERAANRYLPIWIGAFEANAIQLALHEIELARPMTHDLLRRIVETLGARVERVEISALKENTFYADLVLLHQGHVFRIDARPSDAIALAVRTHSPIYVARTVMEEAGIVPDESIDEGGEGAPSPGTAETTSSASNAPAPAEPAAEDEMDDRLSVFAAFLEQIDPETLDDDTDEDDNEETPDDRPAPQGQ